MAVNLHEGGQKFWSLGLSQVSGSVPAEKCVELLRSKLAAFGVNLDTDIVGICTDGASVMRKVGKLIGAEHQLCLAHGVHLAVQDVLYKRIDRTSITEASVECTGTEADSDDVDQESDEEDDETHEADAAGAESNGAAFEVDTCDAVSELSPQYQQIIAKVRRIVKMFCKSPVKNDCVLQKYVKEDHQGREFSLLMDCPTRWNSLLAMLSRFSMLRCSIQKAMI